jgi:hypothetical protein
MSVINPPQVHLWSPKVKEPTQLPNSFENMLAWWHWHESLPLQRRAHFSDCHRSLVFCSRFKNNAQHQSNVSLLVLEQTSGVMAKSIELAVFTS